MEKHKIPAVGSFDANNGHNGVMWGWKRECTMTDARAERLLLAAFESKELTLVQLKAVRKTLAYSWQLKGGDPDGNWPGTKKVWKLILAGQSSLPQTTEETSTSPVIVPTMEQLREGTLSLWSPGNRFNFIDHCEGRIAWWDSFICGIRPREDVKRVKESRTHKWNNRNGWFATRYEGGRCKLAGAKKGNREWWLYTPCCCVDSRHVPPSPDDRFVIGANGNPRAGMQVSFNPLCPMACLQFLNLWLEPGARRRYPNWKKAGGFGKRNVNDVVAFAIDWALANGVGDPEQPFDSNSGRKCLARWLSDLKLWFEEGVDIHGDHPETWVENYQPDSQLKNELFRRRKQATDPDIALRGLRKFVTWLGVAGEPYKPQLTRVELMQQAMMQNMGMGAVAKRICLGLDDDSVRLPAGHSIKGGYLEQH